MGTASIAAPGSTKWRASGSGTRRGRRGSLAEAVEPAVLGAHHEAVARDRGGRRDGRAGFELPNLRAVPQVEDIQPAVAGAYVDAIARNGRGGIDARARGEGPHGFAGLRAEAVDH